MYLVVLLFYLNEVSYLPKKKKKTVISSEAAIGCKHVKPFLINILLDLHQHSEGGSQSKILKQLPKKKLPRS
jgi:hypothetical protein